MWLLLLGGAGVLIYLLVPKTSAGQQATDAGANAVVSVGQGGIQASADLSAASDNTKKTEFTGIIGGVGAGVTTGLSVAGSTGLASAGAIAGAATAGIGIAIGVAVVLWQKHEARIKGAKTENAAMNIAVPGWEQSLVGIISQYNAGTLDAPTAAAELVSLKNLVFTSLQRYNHVPGVNWSGGGTQPGLSAKKYWGITCDKRCTIGCCLFNNVIGPATNNAIALVLHQQLWVASKNGLIPWQKTFTIPAIPPMTKYGFVGTPGIPITVTK
jgi:hypothetical protein